MKLRTTLASLIVRRARKEWRCQCRHMKEHPQTFSVCLGQIAPGDTYIESLEYAGAYESGDRLCVPCALRTWGEAGYLIDDDDEGKPVAYSAPEPTPTEVA